MDFSFEIIEKDWYKRRKPDKQIARPILVEIPGFVLEKNSFCRMMISYDNGEKKNIIGRVIYNPLNNNWAVDGMEVAVRVVITQ